jgi:hypothetical protein
MYVTSGVNHFQLPDTNQFNYATGWLTYNGAQLVGNRAERVLQLNQAYVTVPFVRSLKLLNATFGVKDGTSNVSTFDRQNVYAVAPKAYHHTFQSIKQQFGGKVLVQGSDYVNYYINEKVNAMNSDQQRMLGDIANISWDSADSYRITKELLEYNNSTSYNNPLAPYTSNSNKGHIERVKRCNRDLVYNINAAGLYIDNASIFSATTAQDIFESGMIGVFQGATRLTYDPADGLIKSAANQKIDTIVFQFIATVPLSLLSEFY